jgi:hypothetical protein
LRQAASTLSSSGGGGGGGGGTQQRENAQQKQFAGLFVRLVRQGSQLYIAAWGVHVALELWHGVDRHPVTLIFTLTRL